MILASLCAVAVMALGAPKCDFFRRRKAPKGAVGAVQRVGRQPQGLGRPVGAGLGPGADDLPSRDAVVGTQTQPGREVARAGPPGHIRAYLADYLQGRVGVHAVDPGQVHSRHPVQLALDVEAGRVLLIALLAVGSRGFTIAVVLKPLQLPFNFPVALGDFALIGPV